jgi:membrane protease YdiL (CAAX protease family)
MALAILFLVSSLAASVATRIGVERADLVDGSASSFPKVAIATVQLSAIALMTLLIAVRYRVSIGQIGWSTKHFLKDIRFGLLAFVMALPPIYVLMIASTLLFKKPYNHPVVDAIKNDPSSLPMAIWLAVVIAPLLEEFGFRVLLQGFLESLSRGPLSLKLIFSGRRGDSPIVADESVSDDLTPHTGVAAGWGEKPLNPYEIGTNNLITSSLSPTDVSLAEANRDMVIHSEQLPWWPVIVSGVLFGLAHFDYGASWLPLAALGIVLGYLYRVTNRIWPSLVVHCCLNGMTMLNLTLLTLYGDPSKIP